MATVHQLQPQRAIEAGSNFDPEYMLWVMDQHIEKVYLPFRGANGYGTERAILSEPPHVPHRENNAEHSWAVGELARVYWDQQDKIGLIFPDDFDIHLVQDFAGCHDLPEIRHPDVDCVTPDQSKIDTKHDDEHRATAEMESEFPFMAGRLAVWRQYERKDIEEARYFSDLDKQYGTRMICADGGRRWHWWERDESSGGYATSREHMEKRVSEKMLTVVGCALMDVIRTDLDKHPEYFPKPQKKMNINQGRFVK